MGKVLRYGLIVLVAVAFGLIVYGVSFVMRYQALRDESRIEAALSPDQRDVVYCTPDGEPQKLDLYFPPSAGPGPAPALVYVHGGSFTGGDKAKGTGATDIPSLVRRGYLVASVNYRLAPKHRFPAPIQDVKCAVRFLRANAARYNLDPDRMGMWGTSAGGNLALLAGLAGPSAGFDQGEWPEQSSRVSAVVDMFGPTDLTATDLNLLERFLLRRAFATTDPTDPLLAQASPISYVTQVAPPILIFHGDRDDAVPPSQARLLYERLSAVGAPVTLVMVENANHEFAPTGGPIKPSRQGISEMVGAFFDRYLGQEE